MAYFGVREKTGAGTTSAEVEELIGIEKELEAERVELAKKLIEKSKEERSNNPYYEKFREDLRKAAVLNVVLPEEKPGEEQKEEVKVETPLEKATTIPLLTERVSRIEDKKTEKIEDYSKLANSEFVEQYKLILGEFKEKQEKWAADRTQVSQESLDKVADNYWKILLDANRRMNANLNINIDESEIPASASQDYTSYKEFNEALNRISEEKEEKYYDKSEQIRKYEQFLNWKGDLMVKIKAGMRVNAAAAVT